jgi:flagellar hook-basal body complex protein FliE
MAIEAIAAVAAQAEPMQMPGVTGSAEAAPGFGKWLAGEIANVNDKLVGADNDIRQLATGEAQNLHGVMIRLEEARLSFQLLLQVRNHALEAYQEIMRTQV